MDLKSNNSEIYLIGDTKYELGGSEYFRILSINGGKVPGIDFKKAPEIMKRVHAAIKKNLILSCHDLSEGGLGLAIAEMAFSGDIGVEIDLENVMYTEKNRRYDNILFSESNTRFLVEISKENTSELKEFFNSLPITKIGKTITEKNLKVIAGKKNLINLSLSVIKTKWRRKII
jgi:phosphoribosylformylglycinamidine synthase